ncbi:MAG: hypothetical protein ACTSXJ_09850 [Candidatus Baldrarchaeia archaeon]
MFPLKHVVVLKWRYSESRNLYEVRDKLDQKHFYTVLPRSDVLVATSIAKPAAVIFVFLDRRTGGGDLIMIQTPMGHYSHGELLHNVRLLARIAGIEIERER